MKKVYRIYRINGYSTKEMGFSASKKTAVKKILAACENDGGVLYLKQGLYNMPQIHRCGVDRRGVVTRFHIRVKNFHISLL